ncbi:MAG: putative rane protein [Geminicoccaceae bacterium]|nr:putative rane protein [Geminicoccaceae bacterium]
MTIAWLLYVLLVGALLCAGAAALSSAAIQLRRPSRGVWTAALAGIVVLGVIAPEQKLMRVSYEPRESPTTTSSRASTPTRADAGVRAAWDVVSRSSTSLIESLDVRVPRAVAVPLLVMWVTASTVLLALFALVNARAARLLRRWPLHLLHGVFARVAPSTGPAVLGLTRPEIVVPRSLLERSDDEQRLILAHEREHVRTGDHLLLAAGWLVVIALPWHPAVWYILGRLRLAIELDCDARVLRAGASPSRYGALLIEVATRNGGSRIGALALADGPSQLERRIKAMNGSTKRYSAASATVACVVGALLVLVACEAKIPTVAEIEQMDVASAQRSAAEGGFLRSDFKTEVDYFVNGVRVSGEQARALDARQIGSIEVVRSELPTGRDTIFVTMADRMPRPAQQSDPREPVDKAGLETALIRKVVADSTERTVAHVERELAGVRLREAQSKVEAPSRTSLRRTPSRGEAEPTITIDGKIASEAQLAALDGRDIASIAVYKGYQAKLLLRSKAGELEATSGPGRRSGAKDSEALIAVTTKMAQQAQAKRQ